MNRRLETETACHQQATSDLLVRLAPTAVLALGDMQYERGQLSDFQNSYDRTWGRLKEVTRPVPGNHEYLSDGGAGYFDYFGAAAGDPQKGYYSFDLGAWHLIALNSECSWVDGGCGPGSPQERWLKADLAQHQNACTLAFWHEPRFSSGQHGNNRATDAFWRALYRANADVVLTRTIIAMSGSLPRTRRGDRTQTVASASSSSALAARTTTGSRARYPTAKSATATASACCS